MRAMNRVVLAYVLQVLRESRIGRFVAFVDVGLFFGVGFLFCALMRPPTNWRGMENEGQNHYDSAYPAVSRGYPSTLVTHLL